jgi:hypothetical protein
MTEIYLAEAVFRIIKEKRSVVLDQLQYGGVKSMEHYRELMGLLDGLGHVEQELKSLLNKQELNDE